ncbi:hypothetical protein CVT25_004763 [Psilocybe cyanescens]|uniref:Uncharacterized protein n=1 Tax=Psilocybe cyanescens TaxID=93625 RepID=A0A409XML2_PSICY|nr:hypothetical protein CVT25_004763 [Psilocybe cyanescens]
MLMTNQRLDKLAASRADFIASGMLPPDRPPPLRDCLQELVYAQNDLKQDEDGGPSIEEKVLSHVHLARTRERNYPRDLNTLAVHLQSKSSIHRNATSLRLADYTGQAGSEFRIDFATEFSNVRIARINARPDVQEGLKIPESLDNLLLRYKSVLN